MEKKGNVQTHFEMKNIAFSDREGLHILVFLGKFKFSGWSSPSPPPYTISGRKLVFKTTRCSKKKTGLDVQED